MHSQNSALQGYGEAAGGRMGWWWDVENKSIADQARHETRDAPCFLKLLRGQLTDLVEQCGRLRIRSGGRTLRSAIGLATEFQPARIASHSYQLKARHDEGYGDQREAMRHVMQHWLCEADARIAQGSGSRKVGHRDERACAEQSEASLPRLGAADRRRRCSRGRGSSRACHLAGRS